MIVKTRKLPSVKASPWPRASALVWEGYCAQLVPWFSYLAYAFNFQCSIYGFLSSREVLVFLFSKAISDIKCWLFLEHISRLSGAPLIPWVHLLPFPLLQAPNYGGPSYIHS